MRSRMISICLAIGLAASMIAGCGGTGAGGQQNEGGGTAQQETAEGTGTEEAAVETQDTAGTEEAVVETQDTVGKVEAAAADTATAAAGTEEAAAKDIDFTTGKPWLCSFLEGNVTEDTVQPDLKDDFYLACNREGLIDLKIPEGYSSAGTQADVQMQSMADVEGLFTGDMQADSHDAQLALNLYSLYMDWDARNAAGAAPLKEAVDEVEAIGSIDELTKYFVEVPYENQLSQIMFVGQTQSYEDSTQNLLCVSAGRLLLSDPAEYLNMTAYGSIRKEALSGCSEKLLEKLGYSKEEARQKFENCLSFETDLAQDMLTGADSKKPDYVSKINNHYTREKLLAEEGNLPALDILEKTMGYPQTDDYLVFEPAWLARLNSLYTEENLTRIKDTLIVHGALASGGDLDRECYEWLNDCQNLIDGSSGMLPDETVFSQTVASLLAWPVARLYVEKYLNQEDKDRVSGLIDEILAEYHGIIGEADFLSDETKAAAIEKLDSIGKRVLWPDDWSKYSCDGLEIASPGEGGSLWEAQRAITRYYTDKSVREFGEPRDKDKWGDSPTEFNCFYDPADNTVTILGAFAHGDIYNSQMSDEELYARIGMVIGHEISHAFDSTGAQYDKDGNMNLWWTQEDWKAFNEKNARLEAYYSAMQAWEGENLDGSILTGEACADMGGLKCMLRIAAKKEGFDYDRFFRSYADLWLAEGTLNYTYSHLKDEHPLPYLRVNCVLQQYDEFLDFYGITEGDGMYLAPEDRVNIW